MGSVSISGVAGASPRDERSGARAMPSWSRISLATSFRRRAKGLLFASACEGSLLLVPCSDVHTVGMRRNLDVAFVDADGLVLETHRDVRPTSRLRRGNAQAVLERFASEAPWFQAGDRLGLGCMARLATEGECAEGESFGDCQVVGFQRKGESC